MELLAAEPASQALSGLAGLLERPVHIAAVLTLGLLALELGRLLMEGWRRVNPRNPRLQEVASRALREPATAEQTARAAPSPLAERTVVDLAAAGGEPSRLETALADFELSVQRRLSRTRVLVRAGPALGLMGTLIPLAPGLAALGDGDFQALAADLRVAFAATVVGILVGVGAFALTLYRSQFYMEDLASLERAVAAFRPATGGHERVSVEHTP